MDEGKKQLATLTHGWYGAVAVAAGLGWAFTSTGIIGAIIGLIISFAFVTVIGRKLAAGSSAMRLFCLVVSAIGIVGHAWGAYSWASMCLSSFSLMYIAMAAVSVLYIYMNFRSLRVLSRADVRKHCKG